MNLPESKLMVHTTIVCEMQDAWVINRGLELADVYPIALNNEELAQEFEVDPSFFEGYPNYYELNYTHFLTISEQGAILDLHFLVADNARIINKVEACIKKIKFKPAIKNQESVTSYSIVTFLFKLIEKGSLSNT